MSLQTHLEVFKNKWQFEDSKDKFAFNDDFYFIKCEILTTLLYSHVGLIILSYSTKRACSSKAFLGFIRGVVGKELATLEQSCSRWVGSNPTYDRTWARYSRRC